MLGWHRYRTWHHTTYIHKLQYHPHPHHTVQSVDLCVADHRIALSTVGADRRIALSQHCQLYVQYPRQYQQASLHTATKYTVTQTQATRMTHNVDLLRLDTQGSPIRVKRTGRPELDTCCIVLYCTVLTLFFPVKDRTDLFFQ
jgi:hypothetical protein